MRFGDLTPALAAQNTWKTIKTASPGGLDSQTLVEGVQTLSLNAAEGQKTIINRDELWRTFGPQNLKDFVYVDKRSLLLNLEGRCEVP